MGNRISFPAVAAAFFLLTPRMLHAAADPTGVEGLASFRGDFVPGAVVLAFSEPGAGAAAKPLALSDPTDHDGRYRLLLPPGKYYLMAVKSETGVWPLSKQPGDLFCYYLGNPIPVEEGRMTRVGFNMVQIPPASPPVPSEKSGIRGRVLFEDEPLGRSYIYVYRDGSTNFRGMGVAVMPSDEKGSFRLRLPPGKYYLLARKRKAGGMYGPPQKDDYIGYYYGNPVVVNDREYLSVTLDMTTRIDLLEELWFQEGKGAGWFNGSVVDTDGRPMRGMYVLFYAGETTSGTPAFIAGPTDEEGDFRVRAAPGRYRLLARSSIGGPPAEGEWFGTWRGKAGEEELEASSGRVVRIVVSRKPPQ